VSDYSVIFLYDTQLPFSKWSYMIRKTWNSIFFLFFLLDSGIFSCIMFWYDNAFYPLNASFEYMRTLFSSASLFLLRIWDILVGYRIWTKLETFEFLDPGIGIPRQQELRIEAVGDGEGHAHHAIQIVQRDFISNHVRPIQLSLKGAACKHTIQKKKKKKLK